MSQLQAEELMRRIGVEGVKLTEYEMNIASHLVDPQTIKVKSSFFFEKQKSLLFFSFFVDYSDFPDFTFSYRCLGEILQVWMRLLMSCRTP